MSHWVTMERKPPRRPYICMYPLLLAPNVSGHMPSCEVLAWLPDLQYNEGALTHQYPSPFYHVHKSPHGHNAYGKRISLHNTCPSTYVNRRALQKASACTVATFMLEELILQYGYIGKIVTDNGLEFKGALSELLKKCSIPQVDISPYNSQVNGIVQQGHFAIREALVKVYQGDIHLWPDKLQVALFIDNVIVRRSTGYSAYFLLHGTDSVLPFDLWESTFLVEGFQQTLPCNSWQWSNDQCHRHWSVPMHCVLTKSAKSIVMETADDKQVSHLINRDLGGHPGMGDQSQFMRHLKFFTVEDHGECW